MLDPHNQITETGAIIADKCLYCHVEKPDEKHATFKEVKLIGDLEYCVSGVITSKVSSIR